MSRFFVRIGALDHTFRIYENIFEIRQKKFFIQKNNFFWGSQLATCFDMFPLADRSQNMILRHAYKLSIIWHHPLPCSTTASYHTKFSSHKIIIWWRVKVAWGGCGQIWNGGKNSILYKLWSGKFLGFLENSLADFFHFKVKGWFFSAKKIKLTREKNITF